MSDVEGLELIEPSVLFNILNQEHKYPCLSDSLYMCLFDARRHQDYHESHIITAKFVKLNEKKEYIVPYDAFLECKSYVVVYDSNTSELSKKPNQYTEAIKCAIKMWDSGSKNAVKVLEGGYELFSKLYPFLRTQKIFYMPRELDNLQTYPIELIGGILYLGSEHHSRVAFIQKQLNITGHVNCTNIPSLLFGQVGKNLQMVEIGQERDQLFFPKFPSVCQFIDSHRIVGKAVLVYSDIEFSRNATFAIAYLMYFFNCSYEIAYNMVKECCGKICLRQSFIDQLVRWQNHLQEPPCSLTLGFAEFPLTDKASDYRKPRNIGDYLTDEGKQLPSLQMDDSFQINYEDRQPIDDDIEPDLPIIPHWQLHCNPKEFTRDPSLLPPCSESDKISKTGLSSQQEPEVLNPEFSEDHIDLPYPVPEPAYEVIDDVMLENENDASDIIDLTFSYGGSIPNLENISKTELAAHAAEGGEIGSDEDDTKLRLRETQTFSVERKTTLEQEKKKKPKKKKEGGSGQLVEGLKKTSKKIVLLKRTCATKEEYLMLLMRRNIIGYKSDQISDDEMKIQVEEEEILSSSDQSSGEEEEGQSTISSERELSLTGTDQVDSINDDNRKEGDEYGENPISVSSIAVQILTNEADISQITTNVNTEAIDSTDEQIKPNSELNVDASGEFKNDQSRLIQVLSGGEEKDIKISKDSKLLLKATEIRSSIVKQNDETNKISSLIEDTQDGNITTHHKKETKVRISELPNKEEKKTTILTEKEIQQQNLITIHTSMELKVSTLNIQNTTGVPES